MGNQASALGDEPTSSTMIAQRNLQHFDHNFKASLHTTFGHLFISIFGERKFGDAPVEVVCKG